MNNNVQLNPTVKLNNTQQVSKRNLQSVLGFIFSILSLILFILSFVSFYYFSEFMDPDFLNNVFLRFGVISFFLVPIFSSIGLVLSLLSLKKSKLSIISFIISLLMIVIVSFIIYIIIYILWIFLTDSNSRQLRILFH